MRSRPASTSAGAVSSFLDSGVELAFAPTLLPDLRDAAPQDLERITVEGVGGTIRIPHLDLDVTLSRLIDLFVGPIRSKRVA